MTGGTKRLATTGVLAINVAIPVVTLDAFIDLQGVDVGTWLAQAP